MTRTIGIITLSFFILITQYTIAQEQAISDSLSEILLKKNLSKEQRVITMCLLARSKYSSATEEGIHITKKALVISHQLKSPYSKVFAYCVLVQLYYMTKGDSTRERHAMDSALYYANKTTDPQIKGIAWHRKAWLEMQQGKRKEAVSSSLKALKYLKEAKPINFESNVYYNLAGIYADWGQLANEKKYAELCLRSAMKNGDYDNMAYANQAMESYYYFKYRKDTSNTSFLDSALFYARSGIKLFKLHKNRMVFQSVLAITALNIADIYSLHFPKSYKDSVMYYINIALKTGLASKEFGIVANCYGIMSDYETASGNYAKAEKLLLAGIEALQSNTTDNTWYLLMFKEALSKLAEKRGNLSAAFNYYKEYHKLHIKFFDAENIAVAKRLEAQYQAEKNEAALKSLHQKEAFHKKLNYLYLSLLIAGIITILLMYRIYHLRLKATINQKKLLEKEREDAKLMAHIKNQENLHLQLKRQEAELKAMLKEEETMRLLAEQQLLQERQERLQKDLLVGSLQVEQKDELLQAVQKKIKDNNNDNLVLRQINQIIDQNKKDDNTLSLYKADLEHIHPAFFERLKEQSNNTLSRLDLKHCAYISIGLTNKEISKRLGVAPKSILMSRYRIKLKLGLGKERDLDEYIRTLS